jgi:hypothetical protein
LFALSTNTRRLPLRVFCFINGLAPPEVGTLFVIAGKTFFFFGGLP